MLGFEPPVTEVVEGHLKRLRLVEKCLTDKYDSWTLLSVGKRTANDVFHITLFSQIFTSC